MTLIALLLLPLIAAGLSALPRLRALSPAVTVASCAAVLILASETALRIVAGAPAVSFRGWLSVDGLGALIVWLVSLVGTTAAVYSWGYMRKTSSHQLTRLRPEHVDRSGDCRETRLPQQDFELARTGFFDVRLFLGQCDNIRMVHRVKELS